MKDSTSCRYRKNLLLNKVSLQIKLMFLALVCFAQLTLPANARDFDKVNIKVEKVAGQVYVLKGHGGNIGVLATDKGLVMIDSQFKPLAEKIDKAMKSIVDQEVKYIINTHFHGDHTGGNAEFAKHAPIFTYTDKVNIFFEGENIQLNHLPKGHTDGDTFVYFKEANVVHTGDLFFNGLFPFIDLNSGGTVTGYLDNVEYIISNMPKDVIIIPGHGEVTNIAGYQEFADMIKFSINKAQQAIKQGMSEADFVNAGIGEKYQHLAWSFITEEKWLKTLYRGLK